MKRIASTLAMVGGVWGVFLLPRVHPAAQAAGTLLLAAASVAVVVGYVRERRSGR